MKLELGAKIQFRPSAFLRRDTNGTSAPDTLTGRVGYVNQAHGWYMAEAPCNGHMIRECFHFRGGEEDET